MKKGKVFTSSQLALFGMLLILGAAVWLNVKYSGNLSKKSTKYMGESTLVSEDKSNDAVAVSAGIENDYFSNAEAERDEAYKNAEETAQEILNALDSEEGTKTQAAEKLSVLADRKISETKIESLLSAKGFEKNLAVISDTAVTVIVESNGLTANQTVQIQDIVTSQCSVSLNNIKIVSVDS